MVTILVCMRLMIQKLQHDGCLFVLSDSLLILLAFKTCMNIK